MSSLNNTEIKMAGDFNPEPATIVDDANPCATTTTGDVEEECPPPIITAESDNKGVKRNILLESNRKFISFGYWFIKKVCSSSDIIQPELVEPLMKQLELLSEPTVQNEFVDGFNKDYSNFIKQEVNNLIKEECKKQKKLNKISQKINKQSTDDPTNVKEKPVRKPRKVKQTDEAPAATTAETPPPTYTENDIGQQGKEIFEKLIDAVNGTEEVKPKKVKRVYNKKSKPVETVVSEENATTVSSDTNYLVSPTTTDDIQPQIVVSDEQPTEILLATDEPQPVIPVVVVSEEPPVINTNQKVKEPKQPKEPEPKEPEPTEPETKEPETKEPEPIIIIESELKESHDIHVVVVEEPVKPPNEEDEDNEEDEEDEDDDEYEEIQAVVITVNGIKYLHDTVSHIVYTMEEEETGTWNGTKIEFYDR